MCLKERVSTNIPDFYKMFNAFPSLGNGMVVFTLLTQVVGWIISPITLTNNILI